MIHVKYALKKEIKHLRLYLPRQNKGRGYFVVYCHLKTGEEAAKIYFLAREHHMTENDKAYHKIPDFIAQDFPKSSIGIWQQHGVKSINVELEFSDPSSIKAVLEVTMHPTKKEILCAGSKLRTEIEVYKSPKLESLILP